jgi:hypothetical protein
MCPAVKSSLWFSSGCTSILLQVQCNHKIDPAEPCMLFKKEDTNQTVAVIHADDCYLIGSDASLDDLVAKLDANNLLINVELDTKDYLGCELLVDKKKKRAWLGQQHIVKKMLMWFANILGISKMKYKTPGTPGFNIIRRSNPDEQISHEDQVIYHAGVGTQLYLIKYSRPDIANVVRELSKCGHSSSIQRDETSNALCSRH